LLLIDNAPSHFDLNYHLQVETAEQDEDDKLEVLEVLTSRNYARASRLMCK